MHTSLEKLNFVKKQVNEIIIQKQLKTKPKIIVVTKTFTISKIEPLLNYGHADFGENKLQEAENKWSKIKSNYPDLKLHMIGKLQSNKAKKAVELFDYIHSLDSPKLALKISKYEKELNKRVKLFIQVNLAGENQKAGILQSDLSNFYNYCKKELNLNVIGLMCLPPIDSDSAVYFQKLKLEADKFKLNDLSMGMSSDFKEAIKNAATYLRLGTAILGERTSIPE